MSPNGRAPAPEPAISRPNWPTFVLNGTLLSHDWTQRSGVGRSAARRISVRILIGLAALQIPITVTMTWAHRLYRVGAATRTAAAVEARLTGASPFHIRPFESRRTNDD